jgi:mRNA interferase MazF
MKQYDVALVRLDPTLGAEIRKERPCAVISPDEMNRTISTIIVAPMTTKYHPFPSRVETKLRETKGWIALDQIRAIDKSRVVKCVGRLSDATVKEVKNVLEEMLIK